MGAAGGGSDSEGLHLFGAWRCWLDFNGVGMVEADVLSVCMINLLCFA